MRICSMMVALLALAASVFCQPATDNTPLPEGQFVTVRDGHLFHNGSRLKLWGVNFCSSVKRQGADLELCFDRLAFCGFNAVRLNYSSSMILGHGPREDSYTVPETVMGSGSDIDRLDHSIYLARQRGMFFWFSFNQYRKFQPVDYDLLPDDGTREEWLAMSQEASVPYLVYIDDRAEKVFQQFAANVLNHVNPYTGKRYADEETIALYEIFNEDGFVEQTLAKPHEGIVGRKLAQRWNDWLRRRYHTDDAVRDAWGRLEEGEALPDATVKFAPLADSAAEYPTARGQDVMRFVYDLYGGFTGRFIRFVRSVGKPGAGISVAPITPTGRYAESAAGYFAASRWDFVSVGNYGFALRPWSVPEDDPHYPWVVRVNGPPMMETPNDVVRVADKPFLVYETNDYRPNPYTVEFPLRAAINALWNDADGVFWFTWDDSGYLHTLSTDEHYATQRMPMPDKTYPNAGLVLANDEVALAAIRSAGAVFRHGGLPPAESPKTAVIGGDILLDLSQHSLAPVREALRRVGWHSGVRVSYDPQAQTQLPPPPPADESPTRVRTGRYITFDWTNGRGTIRVDAPTAKVQVGFNGSDVQLGNVRVTGLNRDFSYIGLVAQDGKPLDQSADVMLTMTSRSTNTGTVIDPEKMKAKWSRGLAEAVVKGGGPPVLHDRVSGTVSAEWLKGRWYQKVDFARSCFEQGQINEALVIGQDDPLFYARITPDPPAPAVRKILIIGNSLTRHGASEALGWPYHCGMAATGEDKDYAHLTLERIHAAQPQLKPELVLTAPTDERRMRGFEHALPTDADLVIIQLGDNYRGEANVEQMQKPYEAMIAGFKGSGNPQVFCVSTWGNGALNKFIKAAAESQGAVYVDISHLIGDERNRAVSEGHFTHGGVNWHPGNRGMAAIAEVLWGELRALWKVM